MLLKLWAFIAIRWLRKSAFIEKRELISTRNFILKAERKYIPSEDSVNMICTFSIHRFMPPNTCGPGPCWWWQKYQVFSDNHYEEIGHGKYPYDWEQKKGEG